MVVHPSRIAAACALALASCASYSDLRFEPAVQEVELRGESGALEAHLMVAWLGIVATDQGQELRVRVRVENPGPVVFTLVPAEFELLDGILSSLGTAQVPNLPDAVEPRSSQTFELVFPVPGDGLAHFDLSSLTLRVRFQGARWNWSSTFHRAELVPVYGPYYGYGVRVGVGFSVH